MKEIILNLLKQNKIMDFFADSEYFLNDIDDIDYDSIFDFEETE